MDRTQEQVTEAFEKARWMLGEQMASILATESMNLCTDLDLKPLLVQIVLQIVVVSSWKPSDTTIAKFWQLSTPRFVKLVNGRLSTS